MASHISLEGLVEDMKDIFKFDRDQEFTLKWLDEEGAFRSNFYWYHLLVTQTSVLTKH